MYKLLPEVKTVWILNFIIRVIFYSIIALIIDFYLIKGDLIFIDLPIGILSTLVFIVGFILSFILPQLAYKYWWFDVKENEIYIEHGILTRIRTVVPYSKIQHIDVQQSILDRLFHLSKLILYTAGTRGADVIIPGLPLEYAEQLRDSLKDITVNDSL